MSIFSKPFSSLAKKAIIPLVLLLIIGNIPVASLVAHADEVSSAQQIEIQLYLQAMEQRRQMEAAAEALKSSLQQSQNIPEPQPTSSNPTSPETNNTQPSQESNTNSQTNTDSTSQQPTTEQIAQPQQSGSVTGEVNTSTQNTSSGGGSSQTPFESLLANLHSPTTEINESTQATSTATSTSETGGGININNQADDAINTAQAGTNESDEILTDQNADVTNTQEHIANSGNNTISCNGICEGKLTTGNANADSTNGNKLNTSNVSSGGSGFVMPWVRYGFGPNSDIENGGEGAINIGDNTFVKDLAIIQKNDALLKNEYNIVANTGGNDLLTTFKLKDFDAITGDGRSRLTLLNMVNTNLIDSEWWPLYVGIDKELNQDVNIMDELLKQFGSTAKFNLFDSSSASANISNSGDDSFNKAVSDLQIKISANSENSGLIQNKIRVACNSGHNTASSPYKIKDLNLTTGDCGSNLTLLNFLNTYLVGAQWAMPVINVFGKWAGDLVLPSPDELLNTITPTDGSGNVIDISNSGDDAFTNALVTDRTEEDVFVKNDLNVKSKVTTVTNSGGDFLGFADDLEESSVKTGNATNLSSQFILANATKVGGGFLDIQINNLSKKWFGSIEGAPEDATIRYDERGAVITAERSGSIPQPSSETNDGSSVTVTNSGDDALNIATARRDRKIVINSSNNGSIVNDITVETHTGSNMITGLTGERIHVNNGDAQTNTTIGNVVNTTMIGSKAMNVIVNVFGEWNGKVVFGKSVDLLSVITPSKSGNLTPGESITYTVDYENTNDKEATKNAKLTAQYDASKMELLDSGGATESPAGTLTWNIGDVAAGGSGQKTFRARVKSPLPIGNHTINATSNITSERPESNKENNLDATSNTVTVAGGGGPVTPPNNTNEGTVTGSAQQGNQGSNNQGTGNTNGQPSSGSQQSNNTNPNSQNPNQGGQFNTPGGSTSSGSSAVTLRVSKSANVSSVAQGGTVKYRVTLQNTGAEQASNVKVFDKLKVNGISSPDDEFSWEIGTVPAGEQVTIEYDVNIEPDAELGTYANTAYASGFDSRNKVVLSNDSLATVTVTQGSTSVVQGSGNAGGNNATANTESPAPGGSGQQAGTTNNGSDQQAGNTQQQSNSNNLTPNTSGNHSGPRGVTVTHPDGTMETLGNGSGRSVRSTPNVTRGEATINRAVLLSGALEAQAQTVNNAPITNTNGPVELVAVTTMDRVLGDQIARERNYHSLMILWFVLLLLLIIVGYLAWREQKKAHQ